MLASLYGSPQQLQGWEAYQPAYLDHSSSAYARKHKKQMSESEQWQPKCPVKRSEEANNAKRKGVSRMQVKREAQKAALARSKSNNAAGYAYPMLQACPPFGFVSNNTPADPSVQCDSLKRKMDQAMPMAEQQLSRKRSLVESSWPVELAGFAAGQSVWRLRGGGLGVQGEAAEEPPVEAPPQDQAEAEGNNIQSGPRVEALMAEVASMMETAQREGQNSEYMFRLNRLESIPSLPRFNSLELADEMFADILKWDLAKAGEEPREVEEGEVRRTRGGGLESDEAQKELFLKSIDPALTNREPEAIQSQLQRLVTPDGGSGEAQAQVSGEEMGAGSVEQASQFDIKGDKVGVEKLVDSPGALLAQGSGPQSKDQEAEEAAASREAAGAEQKDVDIKNAADHKRDASVEEPFSTGLQTQLDISNAASELLQPKPDPTFREKLPFWPRGAEEPGGKPWQRPSLDVLAKASAGFGPTSPVASKDSLESPESPIVSSLGGEGGARRTKFSAPQQEKLRALAAKAYWSGPALEGMGEARQLCSELGIEMRQLKKWVESHRPKDAAQPPPPGVQFMGWGMPPLGVMNPAYMSYMAGNPMAFPGAWQGMPRPGGDAQWGGAGVPPIGQAFNSQTQLPFNPPVLGGGFGPAPYMPGGFGGAGFSGGAMGGGAAGNSLDLDENQELVASAEALGKLLGDRVNTIPPEKLKEILAAWMAHKRNKREAEKAAEGGGGVKRKEPEPVTKAESTPPAEMSEGSLLQFSIPSLERGLSNTPSISTLLAEEIAAAAAETEKEAEAPQGGGAVSPGAFKGQAAPRDLALSVLLQDIGGLGAEQKRVMGPLERQVFGEDDDENVQMGPAAESGDDESASSSDDPSRPSRRRAGLRPRGKRRRVAESSGGEEEEEEQQQSEENEEQYGGGEEELPSLEPVRGEGQWQLATGLEGRRLAPPLGYQGIEGTTEISAVLFEKVLTASDTSHLGRWVLPKLAAERYMPYMEHRDGTFMLVEDSKGGRWCCKYRWWPNNKSKMYVLEQTGDIVKHFKLHPGDTIHFCQSAEGHLMIYEQKKNSRQKAPVASAASPAPLPKRYAKRVPELKPSPKAARKQLKPAPKAPRSAPPSGPPFKAHKLPGPIPKVSTRGRTIRPSSRLRRENNPENGSPALVYNGSAGQGLAGRLVPQEWRGSAMLPPGGSGNVAADSPEVGVDPWGNEELLGGGQGTAHINELARHFLQQANPERGGRPPPPGGVPRPLARTGSADLANEILALTSSREMGGRELSPLGAPSRQGSLTPSLQRTKSTESIPFSVSNFPPIPTGLESLSRSSSLNRTASLARAGSLLSRLPSDLEALSKMDNFPSFDFAATPPLPIESAFQPYGGTPGRGGSAAAMTSEAAQNRRRAG